jgi:hypothetical protein
VVGVLIRFMLSRYLGSVFYLGAAPTTPSAESAAAKDAEA